MEEEKAIHESFINHQIKHPAVGMEIEFMKEDASKLMKYLDRLETASPSTVRYVKLAKTALEESVMWATKSIVLGDLNK